MSKPKKVKVETPKTQDEAEKLVARYAVLDAQRRGDEADLDLELARIRQAAEAEINAAAAEQAGIEEALEAWATKHAEAFGKKKTLSFVSGDIGFAVNPPAVKLRRGIRESDAVDLFRDNGLGDFICTKHSICKDEVLAEYAKERLTDVDLYKGGVEIVRVERFFVRVAKTEAEKK